MRQLGSILLISCYELGHQPIGIALPMGFLERAGFSPTGLDIAREKFDERRVAPARFVGISVPMHTALRLGVELARQVRTINPECHICFYGLYASLNSEYLLQSCADSIVGGEYEEALVKLVEALEAGRPLEPVVGDAQHRRRRARPDARAADTGAVLEDAVGARHDGGARFVAAQDVADVAHGGGLDQLHRAERARNPEDVFDPGVRQASRRHVRIGRHAAPFR